MAIYYTPGPSEVYNIDCVGGPYPGRWITGIDQYEWPLPGILNAPGGRYFKGLEVPPDPEAGVTGTASYRWVSEENTMEAMNATAQD